jgi:cytochrome P450
MGKELEFLTSLRERIASEGKVFQLPHSILGVFDPALVADVNRANYADLNMPPTLAETLAFFRPASPVAWADVRKLLMQKARALVGRDQALALAARMRRGIEDLGANDSDLSWTVERILFRSVAPLILCEAGRDDGGAFAQEQEARLQELLPLVEGRTAFSRSRKMLISAAVGAETKRALGLRARPSGEGDLLGAIAPMRKMWGGDRTAYVVTTLLTAIAAAPGFVAACLLYELATRALWREAMAEELAGLDLGALVAQSGEAAPVTRRFIAETLRLWSFPLIANREVRVPIVLGPHMLKPGDAYLLSSYVMHRDGELWPDPDRFDPDRWLSAPSQFPPYAFGFAPRACVGAAIGMMQLLVFCRLVTVEYELVPNALERAEIVLRGFAAPQHFVGAFRERRAI